MATLDAWATDQDDRPSRSEAVRRLVELGLKGESEVTCFGREFVSNEHLKDETILRFYENVRTQVEAERRLPHKFMAGDSVRRYAADLREELIRRRVQHNPIEWHPN